MDAKTYEAIEMLLRHNGTWRDVLQRYEVS